MITPARLNNYFQEDANIFSLTRKDCVQLLLLIFLALVTRIYRLGDASFWADEVFTLRAASLPWSTLWVSAYNPTPPLYYSLIRLMADVSTSEWWLRLPSAIFGTLTIVFAYLAARNIWNSRAALASALLLTLSTINIEYSQEGRAYALAGMCIAISFLGLASLNSQWRDDTRGFTFTSFLKEGGALYSIGVLAAIYSHNTAVFYWFAAQFFFLSWWISPFKFSRGALGSWFAVNFIVLVLWLPWLLASLQVIDTGMFTWLKQYDIPKAMSTWRAVNGFQTGHAVDVIIDIATLLLMLWGLFGLKRNSSMFVAFIAMLIFSSVIIWAYGFLGTAVFMKRTILWGTIFSFMLVGIGISRLPQWLGRLVLAAFVCVGLIGFYNYDEQNKAEGSDWRSPAIIFNQQSTEDDVLLFRTEWPAPAFMHYLDKEQGERRILGWTCRIRRPLFGSIRKTGNFSNVIWTSNNPGWEKGNIAASTIWVVENACSDKQSIDISDNWLEQQWTREDSFVFNKVTLHKWIPKDEKRPKAREKQVPLR